MRPTVSKLTNLLAWTILAILALMPLHAFLTTWLGSNFGSLDLWRAWKEFIIIGLLLGSLVLLIQDKPLRHQFLGNRLIRLIFLFSLIALLRTAYGYNAGIISDQSLLFGIGVGLRYLTFFVVVWLVAQKTNLLHRLWQRAVSIPAGIVIIYGLVQQFVLDKNFLTHFGYSQTTILPYQTVDLKDGYVRAQSLLRGPNPLGIYLSFVITFIVGQFYRFKSSRFWSGWALLSATVLLFFTYSRSAWISTVISIGVWLMITLPKKYLKRIASIGLISLALLAALVFIARDVNFIQNAFFHTDETSRSSQSSNQARGTALVNGLKDVRENPLGQGLGTAGPASARNKQVKIAENYYIQLAQEVGIIGLFIYLSIAFVVMIELFRRRQTVMASVLFASFIGISVASLVSHAWTDDTISLIWWGLAAIALTDSAILKGVNHEKQKSQKKAAARRN